MAETTLNFDLGADEVEMFMEEVNEHLQAMDIGILALEDAADADTLSAVFRAAHTLKALAGTVGHHRMAELTHIMENLFDAMRQNRLTPTTAVVDELLADVDLLKQLRDEFITRQASGVDVESACARLRAVLEGDTVEPAAQAEAAGAAHTLTKAQAAQVKTFRRQGQQVFAVDVAAGNDVFAPAARLYQATMALMEAGEIIAQQPPADDIAESDRRIWCVVATAAEQSAIEAALRAITDIVQVSVEPLAEAEPPARARKSASANATPPSAPVAATTPTPAPSAASAPSSATPAPAPPGTAHNPVVAVDKTVRISVERLDTLMNLVGELVTSRTRLLQIESTLQAQFGKQGPVGDLDEMAAHYGRVVDQLQDEVMRARMLPIASLFSKFPRMVRDIARNLGKDVNLVISGEATELDRSLIEVIGDPLIHLLRNAVDHGVESPDARKAAGKAATGTIRLTAAPVEGQIVITVEDDGAGIDPKKLCRVAVKRGVLTEEEAAQLGDDEAIDLIFRSNFSTAEKVTGVSGRGVGMDVVRSNVEKLNGSVIVETAIGKGTTFRVTLPLTLAIVQTMLVAVRDDVYAIPVSSIIDSLYLSEVAVHTIKNQPAIRWRDAVLPLLDTRQFFARPGTPAHDLTAHARGNGNGRSKLAIVTVAWGKIRTGLVVDRIIGKQEIVVKSLSRFVGDVPGLSGGAILGDGRIALIVDVPGVLKAALQARKQGAA